MLGVVIKTVLLVYSLQLFVDATDQTFCIPDYFRYVKNVQLGISGRIEIPSPPEGVPLQISTKLSIAVVLPTKYVGRLELAQSKEQSIKAIQQGRPLKYNIHFPLPQPIPSVTGIWFNNVLMCTGPRATGQIVTSIILNHTLYPPGMLAVSLDDRNIISNLPNIVDTPLQYDDFQPTQTPTPTRPNLPVRPFPPVRPIPTVQPTPSDQPTSSVESESRVQPNPSVIDYQITQQCGRSNSTKINRLIAGGVKSSSGQWPWLVAIYIIEYKYKLQCAGSLVTNTHIITAAHCFYQSDQTAIPAGAMAVALGRYQLLNFHEKGSVNADVAEYRIHPDYKSQVTSESTISADSDLAVLVLRERVEYSGLIKPICLWSGPIDLSYVVGKVGTVVGWGRDENGNQYLQEPRMINARIANPKESLVELTNPSLGRLFSVLMTPPIVPDLGVNTAARSTTKKSVVGSETCLRSQSKFVDITSSRTFCAGMRDGNGPCNGDSGSAFMLYDSETDRFYIRGVISLSLLDKSIMSCDLRQFVVYVDVAKYLDWIYEQIST
ncbi:Serine protease gd [Dufourea novaeangliae]|uniref:Serine protease gd n=1 Tax=Dufourea novaeangliae TaxID=178035 RepID=A0A154PFE8_DUFNO|nr:Serine protease gd [Dufourea novaeangliae]